MYMNYEFYEFTQLSAPESTDLPTMIGAACPLSGYGRPYLRGMITHAFHLESTMFVNFGLFHVSSPNRGP